MKKKIWRMLSGSILSLFLLGVISLAVGGCGGEKPPTSDPGSSQQGSSQQGSGEVTAGENTVSAPDPAEVARTALQFQNQGFPILYYHSVARETGNELRMPPEEFDKQMAYLKDKGYQSVSLRQLYEAAYRGGILPEKSVVITFDDGYEDNYTNAFPILKKYGYTATVFMVTSYIDGEGFLSGSQLKELTAGGWEIESHTVTHPDLTSARAADVADELKSSKEQLENELGKTVNFFAYPYGNFNNNVIQALQDAGYLLAVTTERGWASDEEDAWHVQRVYCYATMGMGEFSRRMENPDY